MATRIERHDVRVAVADANGLSGYCIVGPTRDDGAEGGEVWSLFADSQAWGTGAAHRLIDDGLEWLAAEGYRSATVWSFRDNERANAFYRRHGFMPDGARSTLPEFAGLAGVRLRRVL